MLFGAGSVIAALRVSGDPLDYAALGMVALTFGLVIAYDLIARSQEAERAPVELAQGAAGDIVRRQEPTR